jgi:hypothetical protein
MSEIVGKVKVIEEVKTYGSNGFRKASVVITTEEQYPQHILVEFVQDKTELISNLVVGQTVKININIGGREWVNPQGETKYFNSITGWRIENVEGGTPAAAAPVVEVGDDDLPF